MLFLDLTLNGQPLMTAQPAFGQKAFRSDAYLQFSGLLVPIDFEGLLDPAWEGLNTRYRLAYIQSGPPLFVPVQATPVQNLAVVLNGQNCVLGLYDQEILTALPGDRYLPPAAGPDYIRQQFLSTLSVPVMVPPPPPPLP